jgi:1,4-alpha-glucan branching enzyme
MAISVQFEYLTGLKRPFFKNARLVGNWDAQGRPSEQWSTVPMTQATAEDGCPCFRATVSFDDSQVGTSFRWGVIADGPGGADQWIIPTEVKDRGSTDRSRSFTLEPQPSTQRYYLSRARYLGAQKYYPPGSNTPLARFAVWAPNARKVEVVFGTQERGYIGDDGSGISSKLPVLSMTRRPDGIWETDPTAPGALTFEKARFQPYMFRVTKADGQVAYRSDIYSRCQIGHGSTDPHGGSFSGTRDDVDAIVSCSVVLDPDEVAKNFSEPQWPEKNFLPEEQFWKDEYDPARPVPSRVEDLIIYELHAGALGFDKQGEGSLKDVMDLLDYIQDLGANAIELLPMSEYGGRASWGYGNSHYFAIDFQEGGRDQFKHLVRACHQRGLAVIMDVVYNHYTPNSERAEWMYDSNSHPDNIYFWYEGRPEDYPDYQRAVAPGLSEHGGYIDNQSTGYSPRFHEELVRSQFISSAAMLMEEFHVDGFRADQTTSMHNYNKLHANGNKAEDVNIFGAKFLREWCRTLRLIRPGVMLMAEDHSTWDAVTTPVEQGGIGFDLAWYSNFYHHLIGDSQNSPEYARLLWVAGQGWDGPMAMDGFAGALATSAWNKVVYHESHDEAGNSEGSARTIVTAVNGASLQGDTLRVAEDRCRLVFGLSALSAGTPMFFMGEEVGAAKPYRYNDFMQNREDLRGLRAGRGARLFQYYQELIRLRLAHTGLRSRALEVLHVHNDNRVIAFRRWDDAGEFLVVASFNNQPFSNGYELDSPQLDSGGWREIFNSDADHFGGGNVGNGGATLNPDGGRLNVVLPARGLVVFHRSNA